MKKEFFAKLSKTIGMAGTNDLDELKVSIDYQKESFNYATCKTNPRGIYVYIKPICRKGKFETSMLLGNTLQCGFCYFAKPLNRKSQKQIDLAADTIKPLVNEFANIWGEPNYAKTIVNKIEQAFE